MFTEESFTRDWSRPRCARRHRTSDSICRPNRLSVRAKPAGKVQCRWHKWLGKVWALCNKWTTFSLATAIPPAQHPTKSLYNSHPSKSNDFWSQRWVCGWESSCIANCTRRLNSICTLILIFALHCSPTVLMSRLSLLQRCSHLFITITTSTSSHNSLNTMCITHVDDVSLKSL